MQQNRASRTLAIISFALLLAALTQGARAEIVYTPVNVVIANNAYSLDLNNDGTTDFTIEGANKSGFCALPPYYQKHPNDTATIKVLPSPGNGVEGGGREIARNSVES
jgi:P pilus assembly chaperone PapD